jgi:hypothetical protein
MHLWDEQGKKVQDAEQMSSDLCHAGVSEQLLTPAFFNN